MPQIMHLRIFAMLDFKKITDINTCGLFAITKLKILSLLSRLIQVLKIQIYSYEKTASINFYFLKL